MVFYNLPRRLQRETKPIDQIPSFDSLADEIQLQILQDIDTLSILRLRLTCSSVVPACNAVLQKRLKTLYIHPRAIKKAISICQHPAFNQKIEEIVLLGRPMWAELNKVYPNFRRHGLRNLQTLGREDRFHTWPTDDLSLDREASLIDALTRLPKLHRLAFSENVQQPGWNQVSADTITAYAHKCASGDIHGPAGDNHRPSPRLADANVFYQLINDPTLRFDTVQLDVELPFVNQTIRDDEVHFRQLDRSLTSIAHLSSLNLAIDCGWDFANSGSSSMYQKLLCHSHKSIEHLKIAFLPNRAIKKPIMESRLAQLLGDWTLCRLKSLEIISETGPLATSRRHRPTCHDFDIVSFLSRHSKSLQKIMFDNVIFCNEESDAGDLLEAALSTISPVQRTWTINRYEHDPRCKRNNDETRLACHRFHCGCYQLKNGTSFDLQDFEHLALRLGVDLDVEKQSWDFGKAVTTALEIQRA